MLARNNLDDSDDEDLFKSSIKPTKVRKESYLTNVLYVVDNCKWKWHVEEHDTGKPNNSKG